MDPKEIAKFVRTHYETHRARHQRCKTSDGQFAVSLTCLSALDIIQLKCLSNATLILQITSPRGIGRIYFDNGQIIHAECCGNDRGSRV